MIRTNMIEEKPAVGFECLKNLIYIYEKLGIREDKFRLFKYIFNILKKHENR
jgi:hypothetical protein